eukprot:365720-Chlamydomonas_euryale.AAC.1
MQLHAASLSPCKTRRKRGVPHTWLACCFHRAGARCGGARGAAPPPAGPPPHCAAARPVPLKEQPVHHPRVHPVQCTAGSTEGKWKVHASTCHVGMPKTLLLCGLLLRPGPLVCLRRPAMH